MHFYCFWRTNTHKSEEHSFPYLSGALWPAVAMWRVMSSSAASNASSLNWPLPWGTRRNGGVVSEGMGERKSDGRWHIVIRPILFSLLSLQRCCYPSLHPLYPFSYMYPISLHSSLTKFLHFLSPLFFLFPSFSRTFFRFIFSRTFSSSPDFHSIYPFLCQHHTTSTGRYDCHTWYLLLCFFLSPFSTSSVDLPAACVEAYVRWVKASSWSSIKHSDRE